MLLAIGAEAVFAGFDDATVAGPSGVPTARLWTFPSK